MVQEQSSAEVAEDYRLALEDLTTINRADISTLTTIARENTENAQAITEALQKHIIKTPAHKKLPAIYVLDSIVKNVGTPYTLFFRAQLYKTFMEAYLAVDDYVRRKMEETLRTWKQPVPQSLDDRPVFPPEVTGPIEDALNKARSSAMALQQAQASRQGYPLGRPRGVGPERATPTPPGVRPMPGQTGPGYLGGPHHMQPNGSRPTSAQPPQNPAASSYLPPQSYGAPPGGSWQSSGQYQAPGVDIGALNRDIEDLINSSKVESERNPHDQGAQQRLRGLLDLKNLLQIQSVPQDQLVLIKKQVADLAVKVRPYSAQPSAAPVTLPPRHNASAPPATAAPVVPPPPSGPASQPGSLTLDSLFGKGALSALLSRQSAATPQVPSTTPPPPGLLNNVSMRSPQPPPAEPARQASATPVTDPMALLAGLRKAGLLSAAPGATQPVPAPALNLPTNVPPSIPPPVMPMPPGLLPPGLANLLKSNTASGLSISGQIMDTIQLNAASLKNEYRPHLLPALLEALGPQCTQCGRRFTKDEGRKKKAAHMDWHFQVHHRLAEAERRGQHRSWYVDGADWVRSRESVDKDHVRDATDGGGAEAGTAQGKKPQVQYMPVPDASAGINTTCPICQEKFENKWLDTAQEWVWLDAMMVGNRAYHISCHSEATMARDTTPARSTPEPVLGKRKAEDELKNLRKIKMDGF